VLRSRRSWTDLAVAGAAVAAGLAAESHSYRWDDTRHWLPDLLTGWALVACGLLARRRTRVLLAGSGFAWFAGNFSSAAFVLHRGPMADLVLTYPAGASGVLPAVAFAYVAAVVGGSWLNDVATIALAPTLLTAAAWRLHRAVGQKRREARFAFPAAGLLAVVLGSVAAVDLTSQTTSARATMLLAYEAALCSVAAYLAHGVLRRPWERPALTDLVVDLGETRAPNLRDALARTLGDPTLEIAYRLEGGYVDAAGRAADLPSNTERRVTRIERGGEEIAVLVHDPAILDDPGLVEAVAAATRLAVANARLQADVRAQVAELEASRRRLLEAEDAERRRLEARLSDGAARRLKGLESTLLEARHLAGSEAGPAVDQAVEQLGRTLTELRELAAGLHPRELGDQGLAGAVSALAERAPVPVETVVRVGRLPDELEATVFFVCSEALANVAKHAGASRARISIEEHVTAIRVEIDDDGVGGAEPRSLADRVEAVGGALVVDSPPGNGTRLRAEVPR
jgi:signal transduction histidine kinase